MEGRRGNYAAQERQVEGASLVQSWVKSQESLLGSG